MALRTIASGLSKTRKTKGKGKGRKRKPTTTVEKRNEKRAAELKEALKPKPNETGPKNKRKMFARKFNISEGARVDPEAGGSVDAARGVGTRGEQVALDKRGPRTRGYVEDQAGGRRGASRARRYQQLKDKVDDGTATREERIEFMRLAYADADAFTRQQGRTLASRQRKSTAGRLSARQRENAVQKFYNTGEIVEGFEPTPNQVKIAIQNAERRKELAGGGDDIEAILAATAEREAAKTQPRSRSPLSGIRAEDAGGMQQGGLKTRKQNKALEAYKKYMSPPERRKREALKKKKKAAKRKNITERLYAAGGGMAGKKPRNANIDYRKGGMFYVGGTSAKVTPINKGKK